MSGRAAITVLRSREEVERLWRDPELHPKHADAGGASVEFVAAPGDRGTEIHVQLPGQGPTGKLADAIRTVTGGTSLARVKDDLRRFKQRVETGVIARSEAVPDGELVERKFKQRPAQPLPETPHQEVSV
jgi:hypothetical protein